MRILLILVGGTICCKLSKDGVKTIDQNAGTLLVENYKNSDSAYSDKVEFDLTENLNILSENMTVTKWNEIIRLYQEKVKEKKYDGIIFAHGTDTLAYSASLFSMILSGTDIPIFFVSANERLQSPSSNGDENFRCAVECICQKIPANVYAVYKNVLDSQMYLHLASRIEQCKPYSQDFTSVGAVNMSNFSNYKEVFSKIETMYPKEKIKSKFDISKDITLKDCVLMIEPYVGINYDAYNYQKFSAVLHGAYHSGTVCCEKTREVTQYGKNSILYMIDTCAECNPTVDTFVSPSKPSGEVYETVDTVANHSRNGQKINFLYGYTIETAYAKILIAYSLFENREERMNYIYNEQNFETIVI